MVRTLATFSWLHLVMRLLSESSVSWAGDSGNGAFASLNSTVNSMTSSSQSTSDISVERSNATVITSDLTSCGPCFFHARKVDVAYWPPKTEGQADPLFITSGTITYTSPSVYITFTDVTAGNLCSLIGGQIPYTVVSAAPSLFESLSPLPEAVGDGIGDPARYAQSSMNWNEYHSYFSSHNCDQKLIPIKENLDYNDYEPCFPRILPRTNWWTAISPEWEDCASELGWLDPPTVLVPQNNLEEPSQKPGRPTNAGNRPNNAVETTRPPAAHTEPATPGSTARPPINVPSPRPAAITPSPSPSDDSAPQQPPARNNLPTAAAISPTVKVPSAWSKLSPTMNDDGNIAVGGYTLTPGQGQGGGTAAVTISGTPVAVGSDRGLYAGGTLVGAFPAPSSAPGGAAGSYSSSSGAKEINSGGGDDGRNLAPGGSHSAGGSSLVLALGSPAISAPFSVDGEGRMVLGDGWTGAAGATMAVNGVAWSVGADGGVYSNGEAVATLAPGSFGGGGRRVAGGGDGDGDFNTASMALGDVIWNAFEGEIRGGKTQTGETGDTVGWKANSTETPPISISNSGMMIVQVKKGWFWVCVVVLYRVLW